MWHDLNFKKHEYETTANDVLIFFILQSLFFQITKFFELNCDEVNSLVELEATVFIPMSVFLDMSSMTGML